MWLSVREAHVVYLRNYVMDLDQVWHGGIVPKVPRRRPLAILITVILKTKKWREYWEGDIDRGKPMPLCPQQISYGLTWDQTRATAVTARRPTAKAMAQSCILKSDSSV